MPVLADANLTDEDGNRQHPRKLDEFYQVLNRNESFLDLNLCIDGPKALWLALYVNRKNRRLELRANLDAKSFFYLAEGIFAKKLHLNLEREESDGKPAPAGVEQAGKAREGLWSKLVLAAIPVSITAGVAIIVAALPEWNPRYTLEIQRPVANGNTPVTLSSGTLYLSWPITERRFWTDTFYPDVPAEVRIIGREIGSVESHPDQKPPFIEKLTAGTYDVGVVSAKPAKPVFISVSVGTAPSGAKSVKEDK